jgi:hypothetical protein
MPAAPIPPDVERGSRLARRAGTALLALSVLLGVLQLYWGSFVDEADNLATGAAIARGATLYRDLFSHHFPLPYWWVAAVVRVAGPSILAVRASFLALETAVFGVAMALTGFHLPLGLAAVAWQTIANPYFGNQITYHAVKGVGLLGAFVVTFALVTGAAPVDRKRTLFLAASAVLAILSDPLAVYPLAVCLGALATSRSGVRAAASVVLVVALALGISAAALAVGGAWTPFVEDVVRFNASVYRKYLAIDPFPLGAIVRKALLGLDLFDGRWRDFDPFRLIGNKEPDRWVFTGLFFRLSVVVASGLLLLRRRPVAAALCYVFAATLLATRAEERFPAVPLVLVALFAASWCVMSSGEGSSLPSWTARIVLGAMLAWLGGRGLGHLAASRRNLGYTATFGRAERNAAAFTRAVCGQTDVALGIYPADPIVHFLTGMHPVAGYVFVYPWVAEVALDPILAELSTGKAVVSIDLDGNVWGYQNRDYLARLIAFLDGNYRRVARNVWISPTVASGCPKE